MRLVVAPDKFKGSLSAAAAAEALAAGIRARRPDASIELVPVADGGEGTVDALRSAVGGSLERHTVPGPLGIPLEAPLARLDDGRAALEAASSAGLWLFDGRPFDPLDASTLGVGVMVHNAIAGGAPEIIVGVGGTATTDGGTGAACAAGWRFVDRRGRELRPCGRRLTDIAAVEPPPERSSVRVVAACDVTNPLIGREGAARVFGPQKGASQEEVKVLEGGLANLAQRIRECVGADVADLLGAGAGGGLGAGLAAFFGAELRPGFDLVAEAAALSRTLAGATAAITGEGRLDRQSLSGKASVGVARAARSHGIPCFAVAGAVALDDEALRAAGIVKAVSLEDRIGRRRSLADPAAALAAAAADLADWL
jgi:glycerate 2-kinase